MNITTNRVEAFSDCVISIVITIMVFNISIGHLQQKTTNTEEVHALTRLIPQVVSYFFSFAVLGIMWINHHHMFHMIQRVDEKFLWLNLHLLFWMSLVPFPTSMLGVNWKLPESSVIYGSVLFMAGLAFALLRGYCIRHGLMHIEGERELNKNIDSVTRRARIKNLVAMGAYLASIPLAYVSVYLSFGCFLVSPALFFMPDGIDDERLAQKVIDGNNQSTEI